MAKRMQERFEDRWPEIARHVERMLASRRVPPTHREDIVQETGLRLYRTWDDVDLDGPVLALAQTIALNVLRDTVRRESRRPEIESAFTAPVSLDVERSTLARVELDEVKRALDRLNPAQRSVLLTELDHRFPAVDGTPAAIKMLRLRARRNLRGMLERAGAFVGLQRLRRYLGSDHVWISRDALDGALTTGVAGVMLAVGITVPVAVLSPATEAKAALGTESPVSRALAAADVAAQDVPDATIARSAPGAPTRTKATKPRGASRTPAGQSLAIPEAPGGLPPTPAPPAPAPPEPPCVPGAPGCSGEQPLPEPPAPPPAPPTIPIGNELPRLPIKL